MWDKLTFLSIKRKNFKLENSFGFIYRITQSRQNQKKNYLEHGEQISITYKIKKCQM